MSKDNEELEALRTLAKLLTKRLGKKEPTAKKEKSKPNWKTEIRKCPKCGVEGSVAQVFGTRSVRGRELRQSWCSNCRAKTDYRRVKRKYNVAI